MKTTNLIITLVFTLSACQGNADKGLAPVPTGSSKKPYGTHCVLNCNNDQAEKKDAEK